MHKGLSGIMQVCMIVVMLISTGSRADLISIDNEFGEDTGTVDTTQSLEFLDLTQTTNISYYSMQMMLNTGGELEGWRYASRHEIISMFNSVGGGIPDEPGRYSLPSGPFINVIEMVGITRSIPDFGFGTGGFTGDANRPGFNQFLFHVDIFGNMQFADVQNFAVRAVGWHSEDSGNWLVRANSIPTPSSLTLLALSVLATSRRSRAT